MTLHLLAAAFAALMLARHGSVALRALRRGAAPADRQGALPSLLASLLAILLLGASVVLALKTVH